MSLSYPNKTQWRILWLTWLLLSLMWMLSEDSDTTILGFFGVPLVSLAALLLWKHSRKPADPKP